MFYAFAQDAFFLRGGSTAAKSHAQMVQMPINADQLAASKEVRGVHVTLGWDVGRISRGICAGGVWAFFGLAVIWFGSVMWARHTKDWSTAWAFGQVLAALIALLLHRT